MTTQHYYTTVGSVRGTCGHEHRTREAAEACIERDGRACRRGHGPNAYSDRRVEERERVPCWYAVATFGSGPYAMPPRGPWNCISDAEDAIARWRERAGSLAGTIAAAHTVRLVGPFHTRSEALDADISDAPVVCSL